MEETVSSQYLAKRVKLFKLTNSQKAACCFDAGKITIDLTVEKLFASAEDVKETVSSLHLAKRVKSIELGGAKKGVENEQFNQVCRVQEHRACMYGVENEQFGTNPN